MNAIWNGVNLAIAGLGYLNARKARAADFNLTKSIKEHHKFQKILLFNAGLDIGYMVGGLYLMERGKNQSEQGDRDQMRGFGKSIILQGGFLFVFDLITAWQLSKDNPKLHNLLNSMSFDGQRIGFSMRFWRNKGIGINLLLAVVHPESPVSANNKVNCLLNFILSKKSIPFYIQNLNILPFPAFL